MPNTFFQCKLGALVYFFLIKTQVDNFFFFSPFFKLKDNYNTVLVSGKHHLELASHRYTYVPSLLSLPPTFYLIPALCIVTEPQFEFPESGCFTCVGVYVSRLRSPGSFSFGCTCMYVYVCLCVYPHMQR